MTTIESKEVPYNRLVCEACDKPLVHLVATNKPLPQSKVMVDAFTTVQVNNQAVASATMKYRAECPFCGDHSPLKTITDKVIPMPEPNVLIIDVEMIDDKTFIKTAKRIT